MIIIYYFIIIIIINIIIILLSMTFFKNVCDDIFETSQYSVVLLFLCDVLHFADFLIF